MDFWCKVTQKHRSLSQIKRRRKKNTHENEKQYKLYKSSGEKKMKNDWIVYISFSTKTTNSRTTKPVSTADGCCCCFLSRQSCWWFANVFMLGNLWRAKCTHSKKTNLCSRSALRLLRFGSNGFTMDFMCLGLIDYVKMAHNITIQITNARNSVNLCQIERLTCISISTRSQRQKKTHRNNNDELSWDHWDAKVLSRTKHKNTLEIVL